jgi:anaerobic selenocysteine-containing dehydrogenase
VGARKPSEWAKLADVAESDLVELAREFTSHGKRAVADIHRGVSQHTSGLVDLTGGSAVFYQTQVKLVKM